VKGITENFDLEENNTSYTLLQRALDLSDEAAWDQLFVYYGRFITFILKEIGVPAMEVEDVTQQVLVGLMNDLKTYDREKGKFRYWLRRVIKTKGYMYFRKHDAQKKREQRFSEEKLSKQQEAEIDTFIEHEWETYIGNLAMERVRNSFRGQAIEVFELSLEGKSAEEVAQITGLKEGTVYTLKKRVKRSLMKEVRMLVENLENG